MAYAVSITAAFGSTKTGLSLRAQLIDTANAPVGAPISTGFGERGAGWYTWHYDAMPDDFRGSVDVYDAADPTVKINCAVEPPAAAAPTAEQIDAALTAEHGAGSWQSSNAAGDGDIAVDHNTGGADALRYMDGDDPVDNGVIRAYLKAEYDAGIKTLRGMAYTGVDGRWIAPMYLDAGTYKLTFAKPGVYAATAADVEVEAP